MSTERDLLRAIRDNPDEDTPRLMYADFLDEEGFSARAEFIRAQIERAQLPEGDPRRSALEDREHELLAEHECDFLGVNADEMDELAACVFDRGFVNEVAASPVFMRGPGSDLCASHPVRRWRVTSGRDNFPEDLRDAAQRGWCARLTALDLTGWYAELGEISSLFGRNSNFENLRDLDLTGRGPLEPLPEILEHAPFRDQFRALRFGQVGYDGGRLDVPEFVRALGSACRPEALGVPGAMLMTDDARDLLAANALSSLTALDLHNNQIEAGAWEAFRTARFRLRELDLSGTQLGGTALDRLLGCASLAELRTLRLNGLAITAANVRALAASRFWTQAEELRLQRGMAWNPELAEDEVPAEADPASLTPLLTATGPKNLRVLDVAGGGLGDPGVAFLCGSAWAQSLTDLDLSQNYISDDALTEIARSGRFKNLRTLRLGFNSPYHLPGATSNEAITDAGLRVLANCPALANLRVLTVSGTRITPAGVEAVLNSPHWRLSELRLAQCQLRPEVIDVLVDSPRLARLEVLDLSRNDDINMSNLEPLAESEYLSPRTTLDVRGLYTENPTVTLALRERLGNRLRV